MNTFLFSVSLPQGSDGLSPTALWAASGKDEADATLTLRQKLAHGFKIIQSTGIANDRLTQALALSPGEACELSSGVKRGQE